ncbi:RHS repeat-associated core domain-containing protein, partial [Escherichia marmotae]|nr:RHS repeat-associated core domain-containing protein [Escherichia marmotae]MEC9746037.1 RHS repeat-associated core domain-containing protein [Escherichia marmotae]MEC9905140.1 RHS repeat-associated core domain-containing protein [Escherichia marmotae]MED9672387.1 RHS repeat-associated core domain-containing protein [Escherichia marmotae]
VTGTVQEVSAANGTLVWAGYQAGFGENRGDISNSGAYFEQPLRLPGQYYDEETGLHYNLFRYYAPECGRFISQDPISIRGGLNLYRYAPNPISWIDPLGLNKNSNDAIGDWVLYDVIDPDAGRAKVGIGKAEDVMPTRNNANRRAETSARKVRKDSKFKNAQATVVSTHEGITKGEMKEIEAKRVRDLRTQGYELPHNRENDKRYIPEKNSGGADC